MARTHWDFSQILKQPLPNYLIFPSPRNANGFTTTANQILMPKTGTKISKKNSPAAITLWSNLILHFWVKWLGASPNTLLKIRKPVTTTELDTATMITCETSTTTITNVNTAITTTTTIPAPTNTATLAIYKTTTTPERPDRVADTHHIIAPPTQVEIGLTTTATDPKSTITMNEQWDNKEPAVGENEEKGE